MRPGPAWGVRGMLGCPGVRGLATAATRASTAQLPRRSILALEGRDTLKFLQGSITNNVKHLENARAAQEPMQTVFYGSFLTPQGRMIADALLYLLPGTEDPCVLVEIDTHITSDLVKLIKRFKLRSKLSITDVSTAWTVHQIWGPDAEQGIDWDKAHATRALAMRDPRSPHMGWRILTPAGSQPPLAESAADVAFEEYTMHRMLCGVPEGATELVSGSSLPLESCVDYMHGGCYIGQELTARTHFTGLIRKRIMPVLLTHEPVVDATWKAALPAPGSNVRFVAANSRTETNKPARARSAGKFLGGIHNVGLALLRLEQVKQTSGEEAQAYLSVDIEGDAPIQLHAWRPAWWPAEEAAE